MNTSKPLSLRSPLGSTVATPSGRRRRLMLAVGASYLVDAVVLAGYVLVGHLSPVTWAAFCAAAGLVWLSTYFLVSSGTSARFRDPLMTIWQLGGCGVIQIAALTLAPGLWVIFVLNLFHAMLFGALKISRAHLTWVAGLFAATAASAILASPGTTVFPTTSPEDRLLLSVLLAAAFIRFAWLAGYVSTMRSALWARNRELSVAVVKLHTEATTDVLTGAANRRLAMEMLSAEAARFERGGPAYSLAILDIDCFKQVNDRFGHAAGDLVLKTLVNLLIENKREEDVVARFGGEEFIVILPQCSGRNALAAAERVRQVVEMHAWEHAFPHHPVTVSVGVAGSQRGESVDDLIRRADLALYAAKNEGKNRTMAA